MGKSNSNKNRVGMFIGGALVIVAVIAWISIDGFPPSFMESAGTIGAAKKYQVEQMNASDVQLQEQAIQLLLQNDEFVKIVSDEHFQAMPKDAKLAELTRNEKMNQLLQNVAYQVRDARFVEAMKLDAGLAANKAQVLEDQIDAARLNEEIDSYLNAPDKWLEAHSDDARQANRDVEQNYRDERQNYIDAEQNVVDLKMNTTDDRAFATYAVDHGWAAGPATALDQLRDARLADAVDAYLNGPGRLEPGTDQDAKAAYTDAEWNIDRVEMIARDVEMQRHDAEWANLAVDKGWAATPEKALDAVQDARLASLIRLYLNAPGKLEPTADQDAKAAYIDAEENFHRVEFLVRDVQSQYHDEKFASLLVENGWAASPAIALDNIQDARLASLIRLYLNAPSRLEAGTADDARSAYADAEQNFVQFEYLFRDAKQQVWDAEFANLVSSAGWAASPEKALDDLTAAKLNYAVDAYLQAPEQVFKDLKLADLSDAEFLSHVADKLDDAAMMSQMPKSDR